MSSWLERIYPFIYLHSNLTFEMDLGMEAILVDNIAVIVSLFAPKNLNAMHKRTIKKNQYTTKTLVSV